MRCAYCGNDEGKKQKIGQMVYYVCDANECQVEFDKEDQEAERTMRDNAQWEAERDNYERYR